MIDNPNKIMTVYTDGSYHPDKNIIGWASVFLNETNEPFSTISGCDFGTSAMEAELVAIVRALESTKKGTAIRVFTDSLEIVTKHKSKIIDCRTKKNQISNNLQLLDLWIRFEKLYSNRFVVVEWIKGHNGNSFNEMADKLAKKACKTMQKNKQES